MSVSPLVKLVLYLVMKTTLQFFYVSSSLCVVCPLATGGGYACACPSGFSGPHCHLPDVGETSLKISLGALVAILVWCAFLLRKYNLWSCLFKVVSLANAHTNFTSFNYKSRWYVLCSAMTQTQLFFPRGLVNK